jgi:hypothetical protein
MRWQVVLLPVIVAALGLAAQADPRDDLSVEKLCALHQLILPGEEDSQWLGISWMPATDIWAARQRAAAEGKPLLLWYMAGEPLGPC